jgi:hypothetical protein
MHTLIIPPAFMAVYAATLGVVAALTLPTWNTQRVSVCYPSATSFATASLIPREMLPKPVSEKGSLDTERLEELAH